ncbi:hypothetical protein QTP88_004143 [Uroleucon formosanum]
MCHYTGNFDFIRTLEMYNEASIGIEDMCLTIANKALGQLGMISSNSPMRDLFHRELRREQQYNINELQTFVISLILANIRSQGKIALALASYGIAATLLDGGRTPHYSLKLPLNVHVIENSTCNISRNSVMVKILQQTEIILLDECTMTHTKLLEAIGSKMQDLRGNQNIFGGALILLSGDFRQTLPLHNNQSADQFSKQSLEIGNGKVRINNTNGLISLPNNFCKILQSKEELIERVFPNIIQNHKNHNWLSERTILSPKNVHVNAINYLIQEKLPGAVT